MLPFFAEKNVFNFCSAKVLYNLAAKNIVRMDFESTVRLDKYSTNNFVKLTFS